MLMITTIIIMTVVAHVTFHSPDEDLDNSVFVDLCGAYVVSCHTAVLIEEPCTEFR